MADEKKSQTDLFARDPLESGDSKPVEFSNGAEPGGLEPQPKDIPAPQTEAFRDEANAKLPDPEERYLSDKQVGKRFGVSRTTVWRWRADDPDFPEPIEFSAGTTRWALSELVAFEKLLRRRKKRKGGRRR